MQSTWTQDLATGIAEIDAEHFEHVTWIERVLEGQESMRTFAGAMAVLEHLESLVLHHFVEEERHMLAIDYPRVLHHRAEHGRLAEHVVSARHRVAARGNDLELLTVSNRLLCSWLLAHLNTSDRELAEFIRRTHGGLHRPRDPVAFELTEQGQTASSSVVDEVELLVTAGEHQSQPGFHVRRYARKRS